MKACILDIEATDLSADFGRILCACVKPIGQKVKTFSQRDDPEYFRKYPWDDRPLVRRLLRELKKYDVWITYYGKRYDVPFIRTRSLLCRRSSDPISVFHIDLYFFAKFGLCLRRRSLLRLSDLLKSKSRKTELGCKEWSRAATGDISSLRYIERHCQADVEVLEEVYQKCRPYLRTLSRVYI